MASALIALFFIIRLVHSTRLQAKNAVYRNTPGEQYFTVSMVTHTVTTETVKYCSPGVFSYTAFFTVYLPVIIIGQDRGPQISHALLTCVVTHLHIFAGSTAIVKDYCLLDQVDGVRD